MCDERRLWFDMRDERLDKWQMEFNDLLERIRAQLPPDISIDEIDAAVVAACRELRDEADDVRP